MGRDKANAETLQKLFARKTFMVNIIVALSAGFVDGMKLGYNTKATVMGIGAKETRKFVYHFYPKSKAETFLESCGLADLVTTCFGGRNFKCAKAFAEQPDKSCAEIEEELLQGQKLQGTGTCEEIVSVLEKNEMTDGFPLIMAIHDIVRKTKQPQELIPSIVESVIQSGGEKSINMQAYRKMLR